MIFFVITTTGLITILTSREKIKEKGIDLQKGLNPLNAAVSRHGKSDATLQSGCLTDTNDKE